MPILVHHDIPGIKELLLTKPAEAAQKMKLLHQLGAHIPSAQLGTANDELIPETRVVCYSDSLLWTFTNATIDLMAYEKHASVIHGYLKRKGIDSYYVISSTGADDIEDNLSGTGAQYLDGNNIPLFASVPYSRTQCFRNILAVEKRASAKKWRYTGYVCEPRTSSCVEGILDTFDGFVVRKIV